MHVGVDVGLAEAEGLSLGVEVVGDVGVSLGVEVVGVVVVGVEVVGDTDGLVEGLDVGVFYTSRKRRRKRGKPQKGRFEI